MFSGNKKKIIFFVIMTFVGLPVIMFFLIAAKGILTQASYSVPENVTAQRLTKSEAVIIWFTRKKTQGVVEYGTSPNELSLYAPEIEAKSEHEVPITFLLPATTYYYQLKIDDILYDNNGVPWTFTTKTKDGSDIKEEVKGISTSSLEDDDDEDKDLSEENVVKIDTASCTFTSCQEIAAHLGKGCSSSDYFKCISTSQNSGLSIGAPTPTPTPVSITSTECALNYLYPNGTCTKWIWEPFMKKSDKCTNAFYKYVLQCVDKNPLSTNSQDVPSWRYDYVGTNMSTNSVEITYKPPDGKSIWCEIRVEDEIGGTGHSTPWVIKETVCPTSTPTPTPTPK